MKPTSQSNPKPKTAPVSSLTKSQLAARVRKLEALLSKDKALALQERELRYQSVFETAVEGIITMGEDRLIESINPAAEKMFGYKQQEVAGKNIKILMPPPNRESHDSYVTNYLKTGTARIIGIGRETFALKKDGTVFPIALSVSEAKLPSKRLFTGVIRDLTEQKQLEHDILHSADEERQRIASDLHDGIGSHLSGVAFLCDALGKELASKKLPLAAEAHEILNLINMAVDQLRGIARGLHPVEATRDGLMRSLADLAEQHSNAWKINCRFECPDAVLLENATLANHLFRIAQEAVTNSLKHGNANRISIALTQNSDQIRLAVTDNGCGFPRKKSPERFGLGLRSMAYRASLFGGSLSIQNCKPKGTAVICTMQKQPPQLPSRTAIAPR